MFPYFVQRLILRGRHRQIVDDAVKDVYKRQALHYGRHKVRRAIREHPAKAAARAESRYIKATADYHSRKFAQEQPEAQSAAARLWHRHKLDVYKRQTLPCLAIFM